MGDLQVIVKLKTIAGSLWKAAKDDNLTLVSAGVAFFFLLSIFPVLAAIVLIYGLVADPTQLQADSTMAEILPAAAANSLQEQIEQISDSGKFAGFGIFISILIALWSGSKGSLAMINALNIAFGEEETRSYLRVYLIALAFTVGSVSMVLVSLGLLIVLPQILSVMEARQFTSVVMELARWGLLATSFIIALACFLRFAPDRKASEWKWVSAGTITATALWLLVSFLFAFFLQNFGGLSNTFGAFGSVVFFLLWLHVTAFLALLGAELNVTLEKHQKPLGESPSA
jgi:membrane protein